MAVRHFLSLALALAGFCICGPGAAAPQIIAAEGRWATFQQEGVCEAASRSLLRAPKGKEQARASVSFDAGGPRRGQLAFRLSRPVRDGSTVMLQLGGTPYLLLATGDMAWSRGTAQEVAILAAMRREGGFRVEARSPGGGRIVDRFSLEGAPLAIDAAAACAARLANR